jgi:hypothetical protein
MRKTNVFASPERDGAKIKIAKDSTSRAEGITSQIFAIGFSGFSR